MAVDLKAIGKFEQGALVAGLVVFVFSFVPRFNSYSEGGTSVGLRAWESWGVLGMLLIIAGLELIAAKVFVPQILKPSLPWNLIAVVVVALGTLVLLLRGLTYDVLNPGWSGYIVFVGAVAMTVFAALSFATSGEKLPAMNTAGGAAPGATGQPGYYAGPAAPQAPHQAPPAPQAPYQAPPAPYQAPQAPYHPPQAAPPVPPQAAPPAPPAPPAG